MNITIDIEANQISDSVKNILDSLTQEQKQTVAATILKEWLTTPNDFERIVKEKDTIERLKNDSYNRNKSEDEIKRSYDFTRAMAEYKSTREIMVKEIITATIDHYKAVVTSIVASDSQIQEMKKQVIETVKNEYPKIIHDAMILSISSQLVPMISHVHNALFQSQQTCELVKKLGSQLNLNL